MGPFELLKKVVETFESLDIPYLVTGSVASMAYGEPRLTNDIDIVASIKESHIAGLLEAFPDSEYYISEDDIREAIVRQWQFNIVHPSSGLKVDVIVKKDSAFDDSRFSRIQRIFPAESYQANFASPEDVIIKKMEFYKEGGSEKHLRDITGILKISGGAIDREYVSDWAKRLELTEIWKAVLRRIKEK
jgi:hypothetical protein